MLQSCISKYQIHGATTCTVYTKHLLTTSSIFLQVLAHSSFGLDPSCKIPSGACQQFQSGTEPAKVFIFIFCGIGQKGIKMDQEGLKVGQEGPNNVLWT